ncbi:MAG: hypothetical protein RBU37_13155 [Myxococcota bacterium]|jgi:sugar (pentulose or hexulose) kinase|nr:hypothetical protein [Myxococcota bacterium]
MSTSDSPRVELQKGSNSSSGEPEILASLMLGRSASALLLVGLDGQIVEYSRVEHPQPQHFHGFMALELPALRAALTQLFVESAAHADAVVGLLLCSERAGCHFFHSEDALTPMLFGDGLPIPAREVPSFVEQHRYRNSVWRRLAYRDPDLSQHTPSMGTLGSWLVSELCGVQLDAVANRPLWLPTKESDEEGWRAVGLEPSRVPEWQAPCESVGRLNAAFARGVGWPSGLPVFVSSDPLAGLFEAFGGSPTSWVAHLSDALSVGWSGPPEALSGLQFSYASAANEQDVDATSEQERDLAATTGVEQGRAERSADADAQSESAARLTEAQENERLRVHFAPALQSIAGVAKRRRSYRLETVGGLMHPDAALFTAPMAALAELVGERGRITGKMLSVVPVGSDGLRFLVSPTHGVLLGMHAGHTVVHLLRAIFEGVLMQLRLWRHSSPLDLGPLRLALGEPWSSELGQLCADIVGEPIGLWAHEPSLAALYGLSEALAGARGMKGAQPWPRLGLEWIQPSERAAHYASLAGLYLLLTQELAAVL